jgi:WD40 repeat protein
VDQEEPVLVVPAPDASFLALSPDGTKIAEGGRDMRVRIRDARTLQVERSLRVHDALVTGIQWHPTQPILATCSEDCSVKIWDLRTESLVERYGFYEKPVDKVLWSPDGLQLCAAFNRATSLVYRPQALQPAGGAPPTPPVAVPGGK